jgi:DNA-3-methyladenine glycosylase II
MARARRSRYEVRTTTPYRLDLTVSALRRLSSNVVDVLTPDERYVRALALPGGTTFVQVRQTGPDTLAVVVDGPPREHATALATTCRMLGTDRDIQPFRHAATRITWLRELARRMAGVQPPRYPTLWEAFVNAVVFQQVSLAAASTITRRMILLLGRRVELDGVPLYEFPNAERFMGASVRKLRGAGLSAAKLNALRACAEAVLSGALDASVLEALPSSDAAALLRAVKGIGPWTATVILLRGFGRLDVFPMNDTSVARNLAFVAGAAPSDVRELVRSLEPQQGMLYYHLLLARLEARGELGRPSTIATADPSS